MIPSSLKMNPPRNIATANDLIPGNSFISTLLFMIGLLFLITFVYLKETNLIGAAAFLKGYEIEIFYTGLGIGSIFILTGVFKKFFRFKVTKVFTNGVSVNVIVKRTSQEEVRSAGILYRIDYSDKDGNEYLAGVTGANIDRLMPDGMETVLLYLPQKPQWYCLYDPNKGLLFGYAQSRKFIQKVTNIIDKGIKHT
jgi:hypothetical protein